MENERKVFVAHYSGHDYQPAEKYGRIEVITRGFIDYRKLRTLRYKIAHTLLKLEAKADDYVILDGTNLVSVVVCLIWYETFKKINILSWDKARGDYNEMEITQTNLAEIYTQAKLEIAEDDNVNEQEG